LNSLYKRGFLKGENFPLFYPRGFFGPSFYKDLSFLFPEPEGKIKGVDFSAGNL
jgi:hypothetical protein